MSGSKIEQALLIKLASGDASSFDELFNKYNRKVYDFSLSNLKNGADAEGVVQEVFLNLWKDKAKIMDLRDLDAWIFTISFNIIRKRFRKLKREREHLQKYSEITLSYDNSTATEIEYNDLLQKAETIIKILPPRQKSVFLLSKNEGLSNLEISEKLKITKKTVENHLTRAKSCIKNALVTKHLISLFLFFAFSLID